MREICAQKHTTKEIITEENKTSDIAVLQLQPIGEEVLATNQIVQNNNNATVLTSISSFQHHVAVTSGGKELSKRGRIGRAHPYRPGTTSATAP